MRAAPAALLHTAVCLAIVPALSFSQPRRGCFEVRREDKVYESLQVGAELAACGNCP